MTTAEQILELQAALKNVLALIGKSQAPIWAKGTECEATAWAWHQEALQALIKYQVLAITEAEWQEMRKTP